MRWLLGASSDCPQAGGWLWILAVLGVTYPRKMLAFPLHDANPLFQFSDLVRLRHLYTEDEQIHLHLQITEDGDVTGTREQNIYSLLEIKAVKPSILVIRGKKSLRYLCMDATGRLFGSKVYSVTDCHFREVPLQDGYNLYFSEKHHAPLTLSSARTRAPWSGRALPPLSHFLPLVNKVPVEVFYLSFEHVEGPGDSQYLNEGSEDPFDMTGQRGIFSPSLVR
ncbi:fibroblast growth factor 19-like [Rhinatrema bivittatum]|uniref:fibroblast growth factor 19-like n=1 Tax=Rhinatrema bivittatum TaxID=194408 RepID=UPI001129DECA|nr:fibroblast growth factor 19-like [Rhinatrema bivittatum]